jgi:hypothetical protein
MSVNCGLTLVTQHALLQTVCSAYDLGGTDDTAAGRRCRSRTYCRGCRMFVMGDCLGRHSAVHRVETRPASRSGDLRLLVCRQNCDLERRPDQLTFGPHDVEQIGTWRTEQNDRVNGRRMTIGMKQLTVRVSSVVMTTRHRIT